MTDKEQFDQSKKERKEFQRKKKMLKFMQGDVNRKLMFTDVEEEDKISLLSELRAIELNLFKLKRNKCGSTYYEFKEGPLYNRQQRRKL